MTGNYGKTNYQYNKPRRVRKDEIGEENYDAYRMEYKRRFANTKQCKAYCDDGSLRTKPIKYCEYVQVTAKRGHWVYHRELEDRDTELRRKTD